MGKPNDLGAIFMVGSDLGQRSTLTGEKMTPVLYLDLDGTVRMGYDELGHFVNSPDDVHVFQGVPELLQMYKQLGWRIVGISNQGGIAKGLLDMKVCQEAMAETQRQSGFAFDKVAWCIHHPDAPEPEMATCWCRKPRIGLIVEAALELAAQYGEIYPPHLGLFVGDLESDKETAANANLNFMWAKDWRLGKHMDEILPGV